MRHDKVTPCQELSLEMNPVVSSLRTARQTERQVGEVSRPTAWCSGILFWGYVSS